MSIRSTSKAIILNDGKLLLNKCFDAYNGTYYSLPGGGQNKYETLSDAVIRECMEETGYTVVPERFGALCEEICDSPEFRAQRPEYAHKMYHIFVCKLVSEKREAPSEVDEMQTGIEWVSVDGLKELRLLPNTVGEHISEVIHSDTPLFLGSEHIPYNHG